MTDDEIEELYQRCLSYGLSVEEAVQQLVIAGVKSDDYFRWCDNRTASDV